VLHEHQGREEVELQCCEGGVVGDLVGWAPGNEHTWHKEAEAQMGILGLGAVVVSVFAVGGCVGDGRFAVEVDVLDVEARGVGRGEVETVEDASFGAGGIGAGGCDYGE
jgi:hypothetical protein